MNGLDSTAQKLLQKDPNNPNSPKKSEGGARPGLGLSKSTMSSNKPSLRETMLAKKKEVMASRNMPARPGSAMSHFSPVRTVSNSSTLSANSSGTAGRQRTEPTLAVGTSGLSVAPVRPTKRRPELQARPATAGPYSVRTHDGPSMEQQSPPDKVRSKAVTPKPLAGSPKRTAQRTRPGHTATASESSLPTPSRTLATAKSAPSPRGSPAKPKPTAARAADPASSPRVREDPAGAPPPQPALARSRTSPPKDATPHRLAENIPPASDTPRSLKVYEDPFTDDQTTPRPVFTAPVLEDKPVNEDAAQLQRPAAGADGEAGADPGASPVHLLSPEKARQNGRLLDSGIARVKAKSLDVHGFRKLQGILRDSRTPLPDDKFDALLQGLYGFLESPLTNLAPEKVPDVKAQILATIKLMLRRDRKSFQPHVSRGLESLLQARACYDARTHIVAGLELLADDLIELGDASEMALVLARMLQRDAYSKGDTATAATTTTTTSPSTSTTTTGGRCLSMGLHILKDLVEARPAFIPSDSELAMLCGLAERCVDSPESGVRMDAVHFCVSLHARVGDARFWDAMKSLKDDPKSVITYYIARRQRDTGKT